jgi:hypothetical protein
MYSYDLSIAASAISAIVPDPSLQRLCICKSPRRFFLHSGFIASRCLASASEMKSRRIAGILRDKRGGLSSQRLICLSINGPIARSSVNDLFCARSSAASTGHRKALRPARRNARERKPLSRSACRASSPATSVFESTFENRFRLEFQGFPSKRSPHIAVCLHPFPRRMRF